LVVAERDPVGTPLGIGERERERERERRERERERESGERRAESG